jgi:hypothetical protein
MLTACLSAAGCARTDLIRIGRLSKHTMPAARDRVHPKLMQQGTIQETDTHTKDADTS